MMMHVLVRVQMLLACSLELPRGAKRSSLHSLVCTWWSYLKGHSRRSTAAWSSGDGESCRFLGDGLRHDALPC